jgi:hypothetical protein
MLDAMLNSVCETMAREIGVQFRSPDFVRSLAKAIVAEMNGQQPEPRKNTYSVKQVADLTAQKGVKRYSQFTLRQACNIGRIKATKDKQWLIPQAEVERIVNKGLPNEAPELTRGSESDEYPSGKRRHLSE